MDDDGGSAAMRTRSKRRTMSEMDANKAPPQSAQLMSKIKAKYVDASCFFVSCFTYTDVSPQRTCFFVFLNFPNPLNKRLEGGKSV